MGFKSLQQVFYPALYNCLQDRGFVSTAVVQLHGKKIGCFPHQFCQKRLCGDITMQLNVFIEVDLFLGLEDLLLQIAAKAAFKVFSLRSSEAFQIDKVVHGFLRMILAARKKYKTF
jgi:hypothetical protein